MEAEKEVKIQKSFEVTVEVNHEYHPKIIGRGGEVIKKLKEDFGVQIQLHKKEAENSEVITITDVTSSALCVRNIIHSTSLFIEVSNRGSTVYTTATMDLKL